MSDSPSLKALKKFSQTQFGTDEEGRAVVAEMSGESDRAAVILAATGVEDCLEVALLQKMIPMEPGKEPYSGLFTGMAPLATFSAKTRLCFALGIIRQPLRREIDIIREMRNACAHSRKAISFKTPELRNVHLTLYAQDGAMRPPPDHPDNAHKAWFTAKCIAVQHEILTGNRVDTQSDFEALFGEAPPVEGSL